VSDLPESALDSIVAEVVQRSERHKRMMIKLADGR
jgi:hypothetical protein